MVRVTSAMRWQSRGHTLRWQGGVTDGGRNTNPKTPNTRKGHMWGYLGALRWRVALGTAMRTHLKN